MRKPIMRCASLLVLLGVVSVGSAADLKKLPANTWVEVKYTTVQPTDPAEKGHFGPQGWNKLVYDPDGKRVLFYDRWIDKKHGGWTIYGNCLFALDAAAGKLTPLKIDNWTKIEPKGGGYRTQALPENDTEPTPAPRHVYHAFEYVPELKSVFICNGANQSVIGKDGKLVGHDACDGPWRLDLKTNRWSRIESKPCPVNMLDDAMAYCPDTKSMVYVSGSNRQVWILDLGSGQFRKAKQSLPPRAGAGGTIFYDPTQKRMLIAGGGPLEGQYNQAKSAVFRELFAFDPRTEEVKRLADSPTALYEGHLAFDTKQKLFLTAAVYQRGEQPSGMFAYDPAKDSWQEIKSANPIPDSKNWFSWVQLCYDSEHDCLIGKVRDQFYAFRYIPAK
jgi:hypothetical protein